MHNPEDDDLPVFDTGDADAAAIEATDQPTDWEGVITSDAEADDADTDADPQEEDDQRQLSEALEREAQAQAAIDSVLQESLDSFFATPVAEVAEVAPEAPPEPPPAPEPPPPPPPPPQSTWVVRQGPGGRFAALYYDEASVMIASIGVLDDTPQRVALKGQVKDKKAGTFYEEDEVLEGIPGAVYYEATIRKAWQGLLDDVAAAQKLSETEEKKGKRGASAAKKARRAEAALLVQLARVRNHQPVPMPINPGTDFNDVMTDATEWIRKTTWAP